MAKESHKLKLEPNSEERDALYEEAKNLALGGRNYKVLQQVTNFLAVLMRAYKKQDAREVDFIRQYQRLYVRYKKMIKLVIRTVSILYYH